jgi:hypothetical protein
LRFERYYRWRRRLINPVGSLPLDFGDELWEPQPDHPAGEWLRERAEARGETPERSDLDYELTRDLLPDLLHAAGGIEHTVAKIKDALTIAKAEAAEIHQGEPPLESGRRHICTLATEDALFEMGNLFSWTKALADRIDRPAMGKGRRGQRLGLLPAIRRNTTPCVAAMDAYEKLKTTALDQATRHLVNFSGHAGAIPWAGAGAEVPDDGVEIRLPDPPSNFVEIRGQFTHAGRRDLESFADELLAAVSTFVDELLDAFEAAARVRRADPSKYYLT